ncbi:FAD-dependent oxidoreductase [Deferribacterales bacterium Es71-Z0220]|uniref:FAD-dependent oxidoreductase n=1 Tax=Deferrivibrio essentukiensis TaxID=2880922 RepID=UPI001F61CEAE|nr:FAD-dependent oxidoreductase [Deferrivibrio essentukiensis]MCB4205465.1 FAD-dependent oxidoreductase [Deferrivibrio essentukiensis]
MKRLYPIYINKKSPCYSKDHLGNSGCPAKNDIPRFLYLLSQERVGDAFYVLKETNPFSAGCGRFCDHPCETACNRAKFDEPVDIKALERFVADWGYENNLKPILKSDSKNKLISIIGSGPAGLSAGYFLAINGYKVVIYEKHSKPGGLLIEGIPAYRYPREIFEKELNFIREAGVEIILNQHIDKSKFVNIVEESDAVIVATGAQYPGKLNIDGEYLDNIYNGIEFLRLINFGESDKLNIQENEKIGVIGGGYTAFDVARCSVRLGALPSIIYRRTIGEMTAHPGEVEESKREGVQFYFLNQPIKIEKVREGLRLICQVMKLGPVDESGRSKPIPIKDKYNEFIFDKIVMAVGDKPDLSFVGDSFVNEFPRLNCPDLPEDLRDKVFICGDAAMGAATPTGMVVRAVGSAQKTVEAVRNFLGEELEKDTNREIAFYEDINTKYFQKTGRMIEENITFEERKRNFNEIVKTVDKDVAVLMAKRCFYCGICIQCDWCYFYSNNSLIKKFKEWSPEKDMVYYMYIKENISSHSFKSVEACPRSALSVISDESKFEKYILSQYVEYSKLSEEE